MKKCWWLACLIILTIASCKKEESKKTQKSETADWMSILVNAHPEASLSDIAMPGSHDAAMYIVQDCSFGANACNTQTQYLDMRAQLEAGIRIFDIRPIYYKNKYYTQHATDCDGLGCKGDRLDLMLDALRSFLDNHAEVVFFSMTHFCKIDPNDAAFLNLLNSKLGDRIYKETSASTPMIQRPLKEILPADLKTGKVVLIFEGIAGTAEGKSNGYFPMDVMPSAGGWSNKNNYSELRADQVQRYLDYNNDGSRLFGFSWQMTQDETQAVKCALSENSYSIKDMAKQTNTELSKVLDSLIGTGDISKSKIPNVIWVDFADAAATQQCLKINKVSLE